RLLAQRDIKLGPEMQPLLDAATNRCKRARKRSFAFAHGTNATVLGARARTGRLHNGAQHERSLSCPAATSPNTPRRKNARPNTSRKVTNSAAFPNAKPSDVPGRRSTKCTKGTKSPAAAVMESRKTIPRRARAESSVDRRRRHVRPPLAPLPRAKPPKRERHAQDDPKAQFRKIPALLAQ